MNGSKRAAPGAAHSGFSVGDCVLVNPDAAPTPYVARIKEKMGKDGSFRITWFYRPEEAVGGRKCFHGAQELFESDHQDTVHKDTIIQKVKVHKLDEYEALSDVHPHDYFSRFQYKPTNQEFIPDRVPIFCLCELPYNPDKDMVQCDECEDWFHWECLKITDVSQLDPNHYICAQCLGGQGATKSPDRE